MVSTMISTVPLNLKEQRKTYLVAVRSDFMAVSLGIFGHGEVPLKSPSNGVKGDGDVMLLKDLHDSPDGRSGTIIELTLRPWVSLSWFNRELASTDDSLGMKGETHNRTVFM